jgi:hypothetical protein
MKSSPKNWQTEMLLGAQPFSHKRALSSRFNPQMIISLNLGLTRTSTWHEVTWQQLEITQAISKQNG